MGDDLSEKQRLILDAVAHDDDLKARLYFTGGTALSAFHLHHRASDDIDLFAPEPYDPLMPLAFINSLKDRYDLKSNLSRIDDRLEFSLTFPDGETVITDFAYYPYRRLEPGPVYKGLPVDSLLDIGVNKLMVINQRTNPKDFVDLYFILKTFSIWDLIPAVEKKFGSEIDLLLLGADLLKVEEFDVLPRMKIPLALPNLKARFRDLARSLGNRVTE